MGASLEKAECLPLPLLNEAYNVVELLDGRSLAFREYGDPSGAPVVFYHGSLSSRLFMPSWDETHESAVAAGARVIAVDRPGYGHSSAHKDRAYMDNGAELRALLAGLDLAGGRRVALLGHESGGPHALAAAYVTRVPGMACQVAAVGLVSSEGPHLELGLGAMEEPATAKEARDAASASFHRLREACEDLADAWPDRSRMLAADLSEASRQGLGAAEQDYLLERSPWDFQLEDVDCRVLLWQGLDGDSQPGYHKPPGGDASAADVARHLAACLPDCSANFVRGEDRLLIRRRWDGVLAGLVAEVAKAERAVLEGTADPEELSPALWRSPSIEVVVEPSLALKRGASDGAATEPAMRPLRVRGAPARLQTPLASAPAAMQLTPEMELDPSMRPLRLRGTAARPHTPMAEAPAAMQTVAEMEVSGPPTPRQDAASEDCG